MDDLLIQFEQALLAVDKVTARDVMMRYGGQDNSGRFLDQLIVPALDNIGRGWEQGTVSLAQVYMSGKICEQLVSDATPPENAPVKMQPKMAMVVLEDKHPLGKTIVCAMLKSAGFNVVDYGFMEVDEVVDRAVEDGIEVLLVSTLMLRSALRVKQLTEKLDSISAKIKIVVGGAPFRFDETLWKEVGVFAMGRTASDAITIIAQISRGIHQ